MLVHSATMVRCTALLAGLTLSSTLSAAIADNYSVRVSATPSETPVQITLTWPTQTATQYVVSRRVRGTSSYTNLTPTPLGGGITSFIDSTAVVGTVYDYKVVKTGTPNATTDIVAAIRAPMVDSRGAVVLVVDDSMAGPLASELARLEDDLAGDGWRVIRHDVPRFHVGEPGWKEAVVATKALIAADYTAAPGEVNTVFLFGHVPVPYSGQIAPDGHGDHTGAWPADVYYGDMNGTWSDSTVSTTAASRNENDNVPGDGKFDQSSVPLVTTRMELAIGRVDLSRMGAFGVDEVGLLRRYLDKHHAFRWHQLTATRRGLIDDNFPTMTEAFAASGWGSFSALVGHGNTSAQDWFSTLPGNEYLLAYGCGGGSYTSASGIGNTEQFASTTCKTVFTLLFGSYFGDWDSQNNFLRAPLAMPGWGLTNAWSGRPWWSLHQMAVGEPIGTSARLVQETMYGGSVHIALMGDPTLRLHAQAPVSGLSAAVAGPAVTLTWGAAAGVGVSAGEGYLVYRCTNRLGTPTRLTPSPIAATTYTDSGVAAGAYRYLVRAVGLETSGCATYLNASQAAAVDASVLGAPPNLALVTPNGGESLPAGSRILVSWSGVGTDEVVIDGSTDGGATWSVLTPVTANDGAEEVTAPATATVNARFRVRPAGGGTGDASDGAVILLAPGGGTWDFGGVADTRWSNAVNWQGDALPASGQDITFPAPAAAATATIDRRCETGAVTVTSGASATWTLTGGGTLSLRGLTTSGAAACNLTDANGTLGIELPVDQTWTHGGGTVTVGSIPFTGPGRISKGGGSWLLLGNSGTGWTGGLTINQGAVSVRAPTALGGGGIIFGTDLGSGLNLEFAQWNTSGTFANPLVCDNARTTSNSNVLSLVGWGGIRTVTFSGSLSTGQTQHPSGRFIVDADGNLAGQTSTVAFSGNHAAFNLPGMPLVVRTGLVALNNANAVVGPDTGYVIGGDSTKRRAALMLNAAFTQPRPVSVGVASAHADTSGAPTIGYLPNSGSGVFSGDITLTTSVLPALHLLAQSPGGTLRISGAIGDGANSGGVAIGGMVTGSGTVLTTGSTSNGTVDLAAPDGSTYDGGTRVTGTLQVSNLTGSATGSGPVVLSGAVVGLRVATAGSGYSTAAVVTVGPPAAGATAIGSIASVNSSVLQSTRLTSTGWGYTTTPLVSVGTGTGGSVIAEMSWGRLTGNGRVAGTVTVGPGCSLAPGVAGVGSLALGTTTFQTGSTYALDLSGTACDRLVISGNLDMGAADTLAVTGTPTAGTTYVIATWTGSRTSIFDTVTGLPGGWNLYGDDANHRLVIAQSAPAGGTTPEIAVTRSGIAVADNGTDPVTGSQPGVPVVLAYRVANTGSGTLTLGTASLGALTNCSASIVTQPATTVAAGGWTEVVVTVTPASAAAWQVPITFATDDSDENPTNWTITGTAAGAPEIAISRGSLPIPDGGGDAATGSVAGSPLALTYTIANNGTGPLTLTLPVTVTGVSNCTPSVTTPPAASIAAGGTSTLVLAIVPGVAGAWSATVSFVCDDADENPTNWTITGTATGAPEIAVDRSGSPISDGGSDAAGSAVLGAPVTLVYTIANSGTAALTLSCPWLISSQVNCSAVISGVAAGSVAPSASTTLTFTVTPTAAGAWSFATAFVSNDSDEDPTNWTVSGSATPPGPEIAVTRGGAIADGGTDPVSGTAAGLGRLLTYTIANTGAAVLNLGATGAITGSNCTVVVTTPAAASVAVSGSTTLELTVTPTAAGAWSFPVSFATDDSNENPTDWTVDGTATGTPEPEITVNRTIAITDGGTDPVIGTVAGTGTPLTYTIANIGSAVLNLGATGAITGSNCTVVVTTPAAASVAIGSSTTLVLTVTPTAAGAWSFPVSFATDDSDENPTDWTVSGSATGVPEIAVKRGGTTIADGGTDTIGGLVPELATLVTYQIANAGSATLTVGGVVLGTLVNCTVSVATPPAATVTAGDTTPLVLSVTPTAAGTWSCPVTIANNDGDENPADWTMGGKAAGRQPITGVGGCGGGGALGLVLCSLLGLHLRRRRTGREV